MQEESQASQQNSDDGNTRNRRLRSWFFTYNNPTISPSQLSQLLDGVGAVNKYAFQLERGENETPHYQGVINWQHQHTFKSIKALDANIHWEPCRDLRRALEYCTKPESRVGGPWTSGYNVIDKQSFLISAPRPWQEQILALIEEGQGDRSILWIADRAGNSGKTALARHLCAGGDSLFVTGRAADIKCAVAGFLRRGTLRTCIFHFTRSQEEYVSYQAIEEIKDGIFFSAKYESGMCMFRSPFVLILANFDPDRSKLTGDRWDVRTIGFGGELFHVF